MKKSKILKWSSFLLIAFIIGFYFWPEKKLQKGQKVDFIEVQKSKRKMLLYFKDKLVATYTISLGAPKPWLFMHPSGQKQMEGDFKTPEGIYTIDYKKRHELYHRSLHISYPTDEQEANAESKGIDPGGAILIHGLTPVNRILGKYAKLLDWTEGCIALTDEEIEEVYKAVPTGCKIEIKP
jgi:murein L,D-transpeptidase YafK